MTTDEIFVDFILSSFDNFTYNQNIIVKRREQK